MSETSKKTIAVDIDDVISANAQSFIDFSNEKYGTHLTIDDYGEHWAELWGVTHEEAVKRGEEYLDENGPMARYETIDGARHVLEKLKENFKLVIITSRNTSARQLTLDWIDKHYPNIFDEVVVAGFYDKIGDDNWNLTKTDLAKELKADFLIDDQPKHIVSAVEAGIQGVLFGDYAWNQLDELPSNVVRVKNWQEVIEYFEKQ